MKTLSSSISKQLYFCFPALCLLVLAKAPFLYAESVRVFESPLLVEENELQSALERSLMRLDKGFYSKEEETQGFQYHYKSDFFSAYSYHIFAGKLFVKRKQTIVRIEGDSGDVDTLARFLELEGVINKGSSLRPNSRLQKLEEKSHLAAQAANLLSPALSQIYQAYASPRLRKVQAFGRASFYLFLDALAYWIGGTRFFSMRHKPYRNQEYIRAWWALNRAIGAGQAFNVIRGHNHLLQFEYSFPVNY